MSSRTRDYLGEALIAIRTAENRLHALTAEAMAAHAYEPASKLMFSAQSIDRIAADLTDGVSRNEAQTAPSLESTDYPRFFRSSDNKLIVLGFSPKTKSEYEHKAPRIVLDQLVRVLLNDFPNDDGGTIEEIKQYISGDEGEHVYPEYFIRSYLRWLRAVGLIIKRGHKGYSIKNRETFSEMVNSYWKKLAPR
jgi:hypothetical protein